MNIENTKLVLEYLATVEDEHFDMAHWFVTPVSDFYSSAERVPDLNACGTAACLAGHIQHRFAVGADRKRSAGDFAKEFLGLAGTTAHDLFRAHGIARPNQDLGNVTLDQMIEGLKELAAS